MSTTIILLILLAIAITAILVLVIAHALTLRPSERTHSFTWEANPEALPNRGPRRGASASPQRAATGNPVAAPRYRR